MSGKRQSDEGEKRFEDFIKPKPPKTGNFIENYGTKPHVSDIRLSKIIGTRSPKISETSHTSSTKLSRLFLDLKK